MSRSDMVKDIQELGKAVQCIAIGEHMRRPAELLQTQTGVPYALFQSLTGLKGVDRFVSLLSKISGAPVPANIRRMVRYRSERANHARL
ncbi:nitrogenase domain-containing protein (plasmid) [Rhizobium gallicum]|uniref:Nitrogenase domain-containing protein n=1 Tax=Rhizobium gallicum TaxID=56730 RepID=A0A1L5NR05_9HYPH|nr:nitrogenase domain-containing protein [Rhizobium gallicum]